MNTEPGRFRRSIHASKGFGDTFCKLFRCRSKLLNKLRNRLNELWEYKVD
mgnify:CR=1 FL=1